MPSANTNTAGSGAARPNHRQAPVMPQQLGEIIALLNAQSAQRTARARPAATSSNVAIQGSHSPASTPPSSVTPPPATVASNTTGWKHAIVNNISGVALSAATGIALAKGLSLWVQGTFRAIDFGRESGVLSKAASQAIYDPVYRVMDSIPSTLLTASILVGVYLAIKCAQKGVAVWGNRTSKTAPASDTPGTNQPSHDESIKFFQEVGDGKRKFSLRDWLLNSGIWHALTEDQQKACNDALGRMKNIVAVDISEPDQNQFSARRNYTPAKLVLWGSVLWVGAIGVAAATSGGIAGMAGALTLSTLTAPPLVLGMIAHAFLNYRRDNGGINVIKDAIGFGKQNWFTILRMGMVSSFGLAVASPVIYLMTGPLSQAVGATSMDVTMHLVKTCGFGIFCYLANATLQKIIHNRYTVKLDAKFAELKGELKGTTSLHCKMAWAGAMYAFIEHHRPAFMLFPKQTKLFNDAKSASVEEILKELSEGAEQALKEMGSNRTRSETQVAALRLVQDQIDKANDALESYIKRWKAFPDFLNKIKRLPQKLW